jgi:hypothetical protein
MLYASSSLPAQAVPLISGGLGFLANTNGGNTSYEMVVVSVLATAIGQHILVESSGNLLENFSPQDDEYNISHFFGLVYLQAD